MVGDNTIMYLTETNHIPLNNAEIYNIIGLKMNNVINIHYNIKVMYMYRPVNPGYERIHTCSIIIMINTHP